MIVTERCPHCDSNEFIKYGKYRNLQRYHCKVCFKTFNEGTGLIWQSTRKSTATWDKYCRLMLSGLTIRQCALALDICIQTSFKWRHKILNHLSKYTSTRRINNYVGIKHTFYIENFKGQKKPPVLIKKKARKKVYIITTLNNFNYSLAKVSFKGIHPKTSDLIRLNKELNPCSNTKFIASGDRFSHIIAKHFNKDKKIIIPLENKNDMIASCANFIMKMRRWFSKFRSVATKYLNRYLDWYIYIFEGSIYKHTVLSNIISAIFCTKLN